MIIECLPGVDILGQTSAGPGISIDLTVAEMFLHTPLRSAASEIRLLRFRPDHRSPNLGEELVIEMQHVSIHQGIPYAAISYVWGDTADTAAILVNGAPLSISRNLHDGLQQLYARGVQSWIWADQICICQSDMEEKRHQVSMMGRIFGEAELVYAWLGPGSELVDQAMDWITTVGSKAPSISTQANHDGDISFSPAAPRGAIYDHFVSLCSQTSQPDMFAAASEIACFLFEVRAEMHKLNPKIIDGLQDILARDYWHRIWMIQEIALAQKVIILCGTKGSSLDDFDRTHFAIHYCTRHDLFDVAGDPTSFKFVIRGQYEVNPLDTRRQICSGRDVYLRDILMAIGSSPGRPRYSATDPRDLAFALIGVLAPQTRNKIIVDYNSTMEQVFTMLTKAMLEESRKHFASNRFGLDWVTPRQDELEIPSWVPDWRAIGRYGFGVFPIDYGHRSYDAAAGMRIPALIRTDQDHDEPFLRFHGQLVSVVTDVMALPPSTQDGEWERARMDTASWLESIMKFSGLTTQSAPAEDYIWRTILRDYQILQSNFKDHVKIMSADVLHLIRQLFRREPIESASHSDNQLYFIRNASIHPDIMSEIEDTREQVRRVEMGCTRMWRSINNERTLFKPNKLMLGLGHQSIKVGDIVTILHGNPTPMILRRRDSKNAYTYCGDAYVDGIMYGEFISTAPSLETFDIY